MPADGGNYGRPMQLVKTPGRKKRDRRRRAAEEARWAAMSGPVEIRRATPPTPTR